MGTTSGVGRMVLWVGVVAMMLAVGCLNVELPSVGKLDQCEVAADCIGKAAPSCAGDWRCAAGQCAFECKPSGCAKCPEGTTCSPDGQCTPTGCQSDSECSGGQVCELGTCKDVKPPQCVQDSDCGAPRVCAGNVCVDPPPDKPDVKCYSEWDCPDGQRCELTGDCEVPPGCGTAGNDSSGERPNSCPCLPYGYCVLDVPGDCAVDADCPDGYQCVPEPCPPCHCASGENCDCAPCPAVGTCIEHPDPQACWTDEDCTSGYVCDRDACLAPPDCDGEEGCEAVCYGACVPRDYDCSTDADCPVGQACEIVVCTSCECAPNEPCECAAECVGWCAVKEDECYSNWDCEPGQFCDFTQCGYGDVPSSGSDAAGVRACPGICMDNEEPSCWGDSDCGAAEYCDFSDCYWPNSDGESEDMACMGICAQKKDDDPSCWSDSDCGDAEYCDLSQCYWPADAGEGAAAEPCMGQCKSDATSCVVSGCSGEICAAEVIASTCDWYPWYACFELAECGPNGATGACGWSANDAFFACLEENGGSVPEP